MGMYDTMYLNVKCPYCGRVSEMDVQTKDLECDLNDYRVGDYVSDKYNYVDGITNCPHNDCEANKMSYRISNLPEYFYVKVFLKDGKITDRCESIKG